MQQPPLLLDVTRLVARSWSGRLSTGIDRVSLAYLDRFADRAHAVVQHRGAIRVLGQRHSHILFDYLRADAPGFRRRLTAFAPFALATGSDGEQGATYLNVGHTDFDLASHARWVRRVGLRPVYLIHDLIPVTHAAHCRPHAVARHRSRVIGALRHGAGIVVSSQAVAQDLKDFARRQRLDVPPLLVAPIAGARLPAHAQDGAAGQVGYFLCVGTIESRKNHALLLEIWHRLRTQLGKAAPRLVIVGQWGSGVEHLRPLLGPDGPLADHVTLIERCDDDALGAMMADARAILMPTLAEGYGLPMAEALAMGVPVIASDLPCFREVGQGIPTLLNPHDVEAWRELIAAFGVDHPECRRQQARRYRPPSWDEHFARLEPWLFGFSRRSQGLSPSAPSRIPGVKDHAGQTIRFAERGAAQ